VGPYDTVGAAHGTMDAWLGAHGYVAVGPPREVYLSEPGTPPAEVRTVIEVRVAEGLRASGAAR
jgi:effector-binding domain-containing protein